MAEFSAFLIVAVAAVSMRVACGTWLHPAALFPAAWMIFLAVPGLLLAGISPYGNASWLIAGACIVFTFGAPFAIRESDVRPRSLVSSRWLYRFVLVGGLAGIVAALISLEANGRSILDELSLPSIIASAQALTAARYNGSLVSPLIATLMLSLTYGAALAAPFAADRQRRWKNVVILCAPSLGGAAYALLTTARAGLLIAAALTLGSWIVVKAIKGGGRAKVKPRSVLPLLVAGSAIGILFVVVAATRHGGFAYTSVSVISRTIGVYAGASIPALASWLPEADSLELGAESVAGVGQWLVGDRKLGATDFVDIGGGLATNVFSSLRALVEDFTVPGALIVLGIVSLLVSFAYRRAVINGSIGAAVIVAGWSGYVLFSHSQSIYIFSNVVLGVCVAALLIIRFSRFEVLEVQPTDGHSASQQMAGGQAHGKDRFAATRDVVAGIQ